MKSVNMFDLACIISDKIKYIGIRPGEKLNEILINNNEIPYTFVNGKFIKGLYFYKNI